MLELKQVSKRFGGLAAVDQLSFTVPAGQIVGLIGPNGAGKTTLINMISGLEAVTEGQIFFKDREITQLKSHLISQLGIARTYQNIRLFNMSVWENVMAGRHRRARSTLLETLLMLPGQRREEHAVRADALSLLDRLALTHVKAADATELSYGDQRRVEIARALATEPDMLLLDEPTAGMNAAETHKIGALILKLRDEGLTVLVIEHDMELIGQVCDDVVALNFGQLIAQGPPAEIKANPAVIEAYLGEEEEQLIPHRSE
jgi:branched-chain amino acid transport system ATP-binding protein